MVVEDLYQKMDVLSKDNGKLKDDVSFAAGAECFQTFYKDLAVESVQDVEILVVEKLERQEAEKFKSCDELPSEMMSTSESGSILKAKKIGNHVWDCVNTPLAANLGLPILARADVLCCPHAINHENVKPVLPSGL